MIEVDYLLHAIAVVIFSMEATPSTIKKNVAIFADYDGCFDIISPSNPSDGKMDKMFEYAEQINRLIENKKVAQDLLTEYLNNITADAGRVILFSGSNRQSPKADTDNSIQNDNGLSIEGLRELAKNKNWEWNGNLLDVPIVNPFQLKQQIVETHCSIFVDKDVEWEAYFFDDIEKYLKYVQKNAKIPPNVKLNTVLFDWYGICIEGSQEPSICAVSQQSA